MAGASDFFEQGVLNYLSGSLVLPTLNSNLTPPAIFMALFTAAPTSDAGTGGTEVTTSGTNYARQQVAGALTTNGTTANGNPTLHFAATVPSWIVPGMLIRNATSSATIPSSTTVVSTTSTTVTMSNNAAGAGVGNGDVITFSAFAAATASVGNEPSTTPGSIVNSAAVISFAQSTGSFGTVVAFALYDAVTSGNMLAWDYIGNFKWLPFTCTNASPGVFTSPAHGYSNGDPVVVTTKYGGTLPTTGGSFSGVLTVAGAATDTFNVGVNTTSTGDGLVRKIVQQVIGNNTTASFGTNQLTVSMA